ncbi:MAG TPA: hypothetical protein VGN32_05060, partial [Ktedonobacterales bacterium]|nr:hypothetical protein [Ktedonobacterales bacterium]
TTEDRERLAVSLVRATRIRPQLCEPFGAYPGVQTLLKQLRTQVCGTAIALQVLSDGAFDDVYRDAKAVRSTEYRHLATFLRLLITQQKNVSAVARAMGLSRMYVVRSIQPRALLLVAKRFMHLAEQSDPLHASIGVRKALRHETADLLCHD